MSDETSGPFLAMAVICETTLQEQTGQLSVIRVIERVQVGGLTAEMQPFNLKFTLLVVLRSGFYKGNAKVKIKPVPPSNKDVPAIETAILLEGDDRGANLIAVVPAFQVAEEGLYWFDVSVNGALFTRIPLRVMYQQVAPMPGLPPGTKPPGGM